VSSTFWTSSAFHITRHSSLTFGTASWGPYDRTFSHSKRSRDLSEHSSLTLPLIIVYPSIGWAHAVRLENETIEGKPIESQVSWSNLKAVKDCHFQQKIVKNFGQCGTRYREVAEKAKYKLGWKTWHADINGAVLSDHRTAKFWPKPRSTVTPVVVLLRGLQNLITNCLLLQWIFANAVSMATLPMKSAK